jgi:prepilin-type N-terminal cleavage/methylation domain-containing protein
MKVWKMRSRVAGFTLIELMIVVAIIGIMSLIAIPNFLQLRAKAHNASAISAGRDAKTVMEVYERVNEKYAPDLSVLLRFDRNLTDDPGVTFVFGSLGGSGYTFTTTHRQGDTSYIWHD